jgi:hypothetical protein
VGAKIGGNLYSTEASYENAAGDALAFPGADINGGVFLKDGFRATGRVNLVDAKIRGILACTHANFSNERGVALALDGAEIGHVVLSDGFRATGEVRLIAAKIGTNFECRGATISNEKGSALACDGAEIKGNAYLDAGFKAHGVVHLIGTKVGTNLECGGAEIRNENGTALSITSAEIGGSVLLHDGFSATGRVSLTDTKIGRNVFCPGATFSNEESDALRFDSAEIGGSVHLDDGCSANGGVSLSGAKIGRTLAFRNCTFTNAERVAIHAEHASIGNSLILDSVRVTGGINLFRASVTTLADDIDSAETPLGSWNGVEPLLLDGFVYERFGPDGWDLKQREQWLKQTTNKERGTWQQKAGFQQGAWQQLIAVYRATGRRGEANSAAIALQNDRIRRGGLSWYRRYGRRVLGVTVGHGYRPWLAGVWAVAIVALFAVVVEHWSDHFVARPPATGSPQPIGYAMDTFLPIIDLGQTNNWTATGWMRWVVWLVILLGWALTTIFVAGFTRIVRSE